MRGHCGPSIMYSKSCKADNFMRVTHVPELEMPPGGGGGEATLLLLYTECKGVKCHSSWGAHLLQPIAGGREKVHR